MSEKRDNPRQQIRVRCEISIGAHRSSGRVVDISTTGLAIQTELPLKKGMEARVELVVPGREPVVVDAVVANARKVKNKVTKRSVRVIGLNVDNPGLPFIALAQMHQSSGQPSVRRTSFLRR
jgi:hypothetical protein